MADVEHEDATAPRERLEQSRRALAYELARRRRPSAPSQPTDAAQQQGMLARMRRAGQAWWQSHPVHDALDVARPMLQDYAEHKPYRLVAMAAGTGAALALLRAWRLVPVTGLALALMKSSDLKAAARSFVAAPPAVPVPPLQEEDTRTAVAAASHRAAPSA
ncbi:MAG TPA: hypothetical protein VMS38_04225 [Pseudorhodoferax sp.]|nr:hypothetical protein [Pseudorhodoferax sp.]